jgi:hypothetical protein
MTWVFEKAKDCKIKGKFPLTSHHRADSLTKQPIKRKYNQKEMHLPETKQQEI